MSPIALSFSIKTTPLKTTPPSSAIILLCLFAHLESLRNLPLCGICLCEEFASAAGRGRRRRRVIAHVPLYLCLCVAIRDQLAQRHVTLESKIWAIKDVCATWCVWTPRSCAEMGSKAMHMYACI
mmetsp:Transcript_6917/g.14211  ORF Transcript_6917/g.14211 Transcript_6917/m.14211 type:complete len:125 (-) Transcript_6917:128-502(-)